MLAASSPRALANAFFLEAARSILSPSEFARKNLLFVKYSDPEQGMFTSSSPFGSAAFDLQPATYNAASATSISGIEADNFFIGFYIYTEQKKSCSSLDGTLPHV